MMLKQLQFAKEVEIFADQLNRDLERHVSDASNKYNFDFLDARPVRGSETDSQLFAKADEHKSAGKHTYSWLKLEKQSSEPETPLDSVLSCPAKVRQPKRMTIPFLE